MKTITKIDEFHEALRVITEEISNDDFEEFMASRYDFKPLVYHNPLHQWDDENEK